MRGNSIANFATALIFCLAIFFPLIGKVFPSLHLEPEIKEMRRLAVLPTFSLEHISTFPARYESFFNDHFVFRNLLIRLNKLFKLHLFNVSGSPKVLVGKKGWLYYTGDRVIDDYRGINYFSTNDLQQWKAVLEKKQDWLASQGIDYLFLVAPNKASVYPEYLPDGILQVKNEAPLDQLVMYLERHSKVNILDLRGPLIKQKANGLLFHRTDTHWTSVGAFWGYEKLVGHIAKIFPQVTPITLDDLNKDMQLRKGGDLALMLGLQGELKEEVPRLCLLNPKAKRAGKASGPREPFVMETPEKKLPRAVMFRDSFTTALVPYLSENFSHIKYIWKRWDRKTPIEQIVKETKPDIVIEESVERLIKNMGSVTIGPEINSFPTCPLSTSRKNQGPSK